MTQEDKELLLKDLSARVPYGVYVFGKWKKEAPNGTTGAIFTLDSKYLDDMYNIDCSDVPFDEFMPYLRPMYSMTKEERAERVAILWELEGHIDEDVTYKYQDWLLSHHFDFRNLIGKGLALEAPEGMYKFL